MSKKTIINLITYLSTGIFVCHTGIVQVPRKTWKMETDVAHLWVCVNVGVCVCVCEDCYMPPENSRNFGLYCESSFEGLCEHSNYQFSHIMSSKGPRSHISASIRCSKFHQPANIADEWKTFCVLFIYTHVATKT